MRVRDGVRLGVGIGFAMLPIYLFTIGAELATGHAEGRYGIERAADTKGAGILVCMLAIGLGIWVLVAAFGSDGSSSWAPESGAPVRTHGDWDHSHSLTPPLPPAASAPPPASAPSVPPAPRT